MATMPLFNCSTVVFGDHSPVAAMNISPSPESGYPESFTSSTDSSQGSNTMSECHIQITNALPLQYGLFGVPTNNKPYLKILEEPVEKFRFRYKSEMMGTHGSILARSSEKNRRKIYPCVQLCNFNGAAVIRCSLYTAHQDVHLRTPHTHRLVVRAENNADKDDPHEVLVSQDCNYTAIFPGMGIIHTAKKHIVEELVKKKRTRLLEKLRAKNINISSLSTFQEANIRQEAEKEQREMNLNSVSLCFEAFVQDSNGCLQEICEPVYSKPINNMKSALTGELKICRIDKHVSSCMGGEEVFILVEKVGKKNIQIKFFEVDEEDNEIWCDYGKFSELDVHHQYAIVFRTPPYRDLEIDKNVDVFVQLYRPTDGDRSEPIKFQYKPSDKIGRTRKRQRVSVETISMQMDHINQINLNIDHVMNSQADVAVSNNHDSSDLINELLREAPDNEMNSSDFKEFLKNLSISDLPPLPTISSGGGIVSSENLKPTKTDLEPVSSGFPYHHPQIPYVGEVKIEAFSRDYMSTFTEDGSELTFDGETRIFTSRRRKERITNPPPQEDAVESDFEVEVKKENEYDSLVSTCLLHLEAVVKQKSSSKELGKSVQLVFNDKIENGDNALHAAVIGKDRESLKRMLDLLGKGEHSQIINCQNQRGEVPLHLAVLQNEPEFVKMLILRGADPNMENDTGDTAIHLAVENCHNDCLAELLSQTNYLDNDKKPKCNVKNNSGRTPLHIAVLKHNLSALKRLVVAGGDVNEEDSTLGRTALHLAVEENAKDIVEYLVKETNIDVNKQNYEGHIALHVACVVNGGALDICKLLMEFKSDPNLSNLESRQRSTSPNVSEYRMLVQDIPPIEIKEEIESDDELKLTVVDDDDDEEEEEEEGDEDQNGHTSIDLARNNKEILKLLTDTSQVECLVAIKEEVPSPSNSSSENSLFDEKTLRVICDELDRSKNWDKLADFLDYSFLVPSIRNASSPTKLLLSYTDLHGHVSAEDIRTYLEALNEEKAIEAVDLMLAKKLVKDSMSS